MLTMFLSRLDDTRAVYPTFCRLIRVGLLGNSVQIVVETFHNPGEPSARPVRVRPIPGQFNRSYRVWCSVAARRERPVGSLFLVHVTEVHQPQGESYLRISQREEWQPISTAQAANFLKSRHLL